MHIAVIFHATLCRYGGGREKVTVQMPDGSTIAAVAEHFGMFLGQAELVLLNGGVADAQAVLHDGDIVEFYPVCGGG